MAVTASLTSSTLPIEPGGSTTFELSVRNDGSSAEAVRVEVTGAARPYSFVIPDTFSLEAGADAKVKVGFRVPRTSVPAAGPMPFQVKLSGSSTTFVDGMLDVAPFSALSATLDPPEATSRGATSHRVSVGNRGNAPVTIAFTATSGVADGLDLRVDPATAIAPPDGTATATLDAAPRSRAFAGADRTLPFTVVATPDVGSPVELKGRLVQKARFATKTLVSSAALVGVVVVGLVLAVAASSGGSSSSSAKTTVTTSGGVTDAAASNCPAQGHFDRYQANGLHPEDIPTLPPTYSFLQVKSDGCSPIRFDPCEPIHYIQNVTLAPPTGPADVRQAFAMLGAATGMTFVDDGTTTESGRRAPYVPSLYPGRWAPILVNWIHFPNQGNDPSIQAVGAGSGIRVGDAFVSGVLNLNVDAVTNKDTRTPVQGGFGPPIGSGTGAIGPEGVTWGRIILHELAHVVGLGHTKDKGAIMYPESADQTSRPAEYKQPDLDGLRYLGKEAGCFTPPPLPSS
jgi:hypothetical protein